MSFLARLIPVLSLAVCLVVAGCAATTVATTGTVLGQPICRADDAPMPTVVFWGAHWRADQKEPSVREALALRGIEDFIAHTDCLALAGLERLDGIPSDAELLQRAGDKLPTGGRVIRVVVHELGPRLLIGIPALVEGGTEVVIDVRVLDTASATALADMHTQWHHGGKFYIKGIKSLDRDMSAALRATLMPAAPAPEGDHAAKQ